MRSPTTCLLLTLAAGLFAALPLSGTAFAAADEPATVRADVDGDGLPDQVSATRTDDSEGTWQLTVQSSATGAVDVLYGNTFAALPPRILASVDADGRAGVELFVDVGHISTYDWIGIFTFRNGHVRRAATLNAFGSDFDYKFGLKCVSNAGGHFVVAYAFSWVRARRWRWTATSYRWQDGTLRRASPVRRGVIRRTRPPRSQTRVAC